MKASDAQKPKQVRRKDRNSSDDGLTEREWLWIQRVAAGSGFVEAVGSRPSTPRLKEAIATGRLCDSQLQQALVARLLLSGQVERANEVLAFAAAQAALRAMQKDGKLAATLLPKGRSKGPKGPAVALPEARSSGESPE